jgi:hypothetical protein
MEMTRIEMIGVLQERIHDCSLIAEMQDDHGDSLTSMETYAIVDNLSIVLEFINSLPEDFFPYP